MTQVIAILFLLTTTLAAQNYPWHESYDSTRSIVTQIAPPDGYTRQSVEAGSFAAWLRGLPLLADGTPVLLHDGQRKGRQDVHAAVIDIDIGRRDLQQCADAVMRLRAEYLYSKQQYDLITFNYTSGDHVPFSRWIDGERPVVQGNDVIWKGANATGSSYSQFRRYLQQIFIYAGTASLSRELKPVHSLAEVEIGDVFIQGGFPGHAVIVLDLAMDTAGKKMMLLAQSYMPAQNIHILVNKTDGDVSPWYDTEFGDILYTPEWTFKSTDLRRFE